MTAGDVIELFNSGRCNAVVRSVGSAMGGDQAGDGLLGLLNDVDERAGDWYALSKDMYTSSSGCRYGLDIPSDDISRSEDTLLLDGPCIGRGEAGILDL